MKTTPILAAIVITGTAVAAFAHGNAKGIVRDRMESMEAMGDAVKAVTPMMRGERTYDAAAMRNTARIFQKHAGEALTDLFPKGSGGAPSEAKDAVWADWDRFAALARQLEIYAEGLEGAAGNGLAGGGGMGAGSMMGNSSGMGSGSMMGNGSMMGSGTSMMGGGAGMMRAEDIAAMPADAAFAMTTQVCSACHSRFRAEDH
ncbi:c-type cytochrome [Phaeobacter gallaeciensis]|uniref:c-type cytochrome n=1 Tax=Phaeobacter gallaeciensis TaxID=60890 RepID=UPI00237FD647|nr:cytochrome c [Phaeobacter gallaeciensis]MDE4190869.1 cytochrome c [Phaeobacter gallaeciensis]MDE4199335.1 cytochrome c [Phaeobacter gallaeciensis]MDE4203483.1 cytochrome c [Phaeobacter gallaeciensis]MDE4207625.1 cytochrome c [Phaeobacter gallaeciensis]MDE4215992.1 cytochrome c [Phaeobacter gallaeciensis]